MVACYINGVRRRPRPGQGSLQKSVATFSTSTVPPEDLTHDFQLPPVVGEDSQDFSDSSRSPSPSHSPQASMEADMNRTEDYTQDHILKDDTPKMNIEDEELDPEDLRPLEGSSSTGRAEPHQATATLNGSQKSNSFGFFSQHRWRAMENERTGCLQELREALNVEIERRRDNMTAQRELHESRVRIQRDIQELELRMKSLREEKIRNEEERFAERESRVWINARVEKLEGEIELVEREIDEIREAEKNQFAGKDHEA
ncbi:hypothetical protein H0H81_005481 [Sphagnurus paluster]|uniref:Uncharacterized protein n=1 Tax=Sphagnurus paluster TaxID=117069 RepID=A0A9P7FYK1_9AGAR|nr:hypothetical protein H0H81_005481 [Sphagnurus paluster]